MPHLCPQTLTKSEQTAILKATVLITKLFPLQAAPETDRLVLP